MELAVGNILAGKVTGITKFGAFVLLEPGKSGLVHISEIANTFVNNVSDFLSVGQEVAVKVIGIDQSGRINLSIKAALPAPPQSPRPAQTNRQPSQRSAQAAPFSPPSQRSAPPQTRRSAPPTEADLFGEKLPTSNDPSFEDKLKKFMQLSDSKIADARQYSERGGGRRRRK